ncbi:MAG TPA: hypothetical protein ENI27_05710 [bacterium]|nr:hypothetical protein [bacterium]
MIEKTLGLFVISVSIFVLCLSAGVIKRELFPTPYCLHVAEQMNSNMDLIEKKLNEPERSER